MTPSVVDPLEVVEVEQRHRKAAVVPLRLGPGLLEPLEVVTPVEQAGEGIGAGRHRQLGAHLLQPLHRLAMADHQGKNIGDAFEKRQLGGMGWMSLRQIEDNHPQHPLAVADGNIVVPVGHDARIADLMAVVDAGSMLDRTLLGGAAAQAMAVRHPRAQPQDRRGQIPLGHQP